ncbi:MAG: hypothetical protein GX862_01265, partial [Leucobacter sp.]|nr:hypothetical protein [Leucobacter sp.]
PTVLLSLVAAALGRWLTRFNTFTQSLVFGAAAVVVAFLLTVVIDAFTILGRVCEPNVYCTGFGESVIWVTYFYLGPLFLVAVLAYGLAVWTASNSRTRRVLVPAVVISLLLVTALAVFVPTQGSGLGSSSAVREAPERMGEAGDVNAVGGAGEQCTMIEPDGVEREIDCPRTATGERHGLNSRG